MMKALILLLLAGAAQAGSPVDYTAPSQTLSSLGSAASGVNTDITALNGATSISLVPVAFGSTVTFNGSIGLSTAASPSVTTAPNILVNQSGQTTFGISLSSGQTSASISGTFTQTSLGACQAASTNTITLPANSSGKVMLIFNGNAKSSVVNSTMTVGVLVDGGYLTGESASKGIVSDGDSGALLAAGFDVSLGFTRVVTGLTNATHSFCLGFFTTSGTGTIESTTSDAVFSIIALP